MRHLLYRCDGQCGERFEGEWLHACREGWKTLDGEKHYCRRCSRKYVSRNGVQAIEESDARVISLARE